jgi:hypothetical protein
MIKTSTLKTPKQTPAAKAGDRGRVEPPAPDEKPRQRDDYNGYHRWYRRQGKAAKENGETR